jgi:hypothetical protein
MKDPHPYVRDTTAWTISRVFEFQHDAGDANVPELITRETLPQVAQVSCARRCGSHQACVLDRTAACACKRADSSPLLLSALAGCACAECSQPCVGHPS